MNVMIDLDSTWWNDPPMCRILINDCEIFSGPIKQPQTIEHDIDESNKTEGSIKVLMYNKTDSQTVINDNVIVKDQLLHIKKIVIDEIDLGLLIFTKSFYKPEYPGHLRSDMPVILEQIDTMGWNGIWQLDFTIPFHIWYRTSKQR